MSRLFLSVRESKAPECFAGQFSGCRLCAVDASRIALAHRLGSRTHPIVNTAILGAFARATGVVSLDAVCEAIREEVPSHHQANVEAAREAFERVVVAEEVAP